MRLAGPLIAFATIAVAACDSAPAPPGIAGEGFGPASYHYFLRDSVGIERGGGWTYAFEVASGDTVRQAFSARVTNEAGEANRYEAELTAVCESAGGEPPALALTIVVESGLRWHLVGETSAGCGLGDGTWVRLDGGEVVSGGTYGVGVAVP